MYQRNAQGWLKHLDFILLDLVCLHVSFVLAYMFRHGIRNPYVNDSYIDLLIVLTLTDVLTAISVKTFKNVLKRGSFAEGAKTIKQVCVVLVSATFYLFMVKSGAEVSRTVVYVFAVLYGLLSFLCRLLWKKILRKRLAGKRERSMVIVTVPQMIDEVMERLHNNRLEHFRIAGIVLLDGEQEEEKEFRLGDKRRRIRILPYSSDTVNRVCREWVDEALLCIPHGQSYPEKLLGQLLEMGIVVHISLEENLAPYGQKQFLERFGGYTVLTTSINYADSGQLLIKRIMDILFGIMGCLIVSLLTLFIGTAIYIQSPGPIFFSQTRVGKGGRKFRMYKFRSMYPDAEERKKELMEQNRVDGYMFKLDYDPRIIGCKRQPDGTVKKGIGNFIRDWSLDEFPQFLNVLKGDMSLVGTRPPTVDEWENYALHHRARLAIKPGITGLWQVSGRSNITDFEEVVKLDTKYITEWSLGLDLKIFFKTIRVVFGKDGAM